MVHSIEAEQVQPIFRNKWTKGRKRDLIHLTEAGQIQPLLIYKWTRGSIRD